jgi:ADP-ribose pyrophosphatase
MNEILHSNKYFQVEERRYILNDVPKRHFLVTEKFQCSGAVAVALFADGDFLMIEHYRPAIDEISREFARGACEEGHTTAQTATKELLEETGYAGDEPEFLGKLHTNNSMIASSIDLYVIRNVKQVTQETDGEVARSLKVGKNELKESIRSGLITDSHTLAAYAFLASQ